MAEIGMAETEAAIHWPKKTRELQTAIFDSTRWNQFKYREGDVIVVTWGKAGTTWMQQIVAQLLWDAPDDISTMAMRSPWLDMRILPFEFVLPALEAQTHRRSIKTHLPIDALPFSPKAKYVYVGRDARDIVWSAYNHQMSFTEAAVDKFNNLPGRVGPPLTYPDCDIRDYYLRWLEDDALPGFPLMSLWDHVQGWWDARHLANVKLVHFNNLKSDMPGEIRRVADFLDVEIDEAKWPAILEHCGFDYMRTAAKALTQLDANFKGGGESFFHKGTNGRWKDMLSAEEIAKCDDVAARKLTPDCAHWLKTGEIRS
jgi:aryl sulfotransferase